MTTIHLTSLIGEPNYRSGSGSVSAHLPFPKSQQISSPSGEGGGQVAAGSLDIVTKGSSPGASNKSDTMYVYGELGI